MAEKVSKIKLPFTSSASEPEVPEEPASLLDSLSDSESTYNCDMCYTDGDLIPCCSKCSGEMHLHCLERTLELGALSCPLCGAAYRIESGSGPFLPSEEEAIVSATAALLGALWGILQLILGGAAFHNAALLSSYDVYCIAASLLAALLLSATNVVLQILRTREYFQQRLLLGKLVSQLAMWLPPVIGLLYLTSFFVTLLLPMRSVSFADPVIMLLISVLSRIVFSTVLFCILAAALILAQLLKRQMCPAVTASPATLRVRIRDQTIYVKVPESEFSDSEFFFM